MIPGDRVEKGQVICIVEAMKLMNELESEVSGQIVRAYVENGVKVYISSRKADACAKLAEDLSKIGECAALPAEPSVRRR